LFTGAITKAVNEEEHTKFKAEKFSIIWPNNSELYAMRLCKILEFDEEVSELFSNYNEVGMEGVRRSVFDARENKASIKLSFREALQKDLFDKEFKNMMGKNRNDDYLS